MPTPIRTDPARPGPPRDNPGRSDPRPGLTLSGAQRKALTEVLRISPVADELGRRFVRAGHELHLVGGSVRDALIGRLGDDLDFATSAHPEQTLQMLRG